MTRGKIRGECNSVSGALKAALPREGIVAGEGA